MNGPDLPRWLTASHLEAPVRRLHGTDDATVDSWSCEAITGGFGETIGVWRVTGTATADGTLQPFTLILKGWSLTGGTGDPASWNLPEREIRAYASGILEDLPGAIDAPRCLGTVALDDGSSWAWLTPMSDEALTRWDLDHFALVARHLGGFNGAYLTGRPIPDTPWLSRQWTRQWTEAAKPTIEQLELHASSPYLAQALSAATVRAYRQLFDERLRWFDAMDTLPQTFCHLDAFKRNVFLRPDRDGSLRPGLIDWGFVGVAAAGEEIAPLVSASISFGEAVGIPFDTLDSTVFENYIVGLTDAGWQGSERLVRMGFTGSLVMRYVLGPLRISLPLIINDELHPVIEHRLGMSIAEFVELIMAHNEWALGLADEFRQHLASLPSAA